MILVMKGRGRRSLLLLPEFSVRLKLCFFFFLNRELDSLHLNNKSRVVHVIAVGKEEPTLTLM
jgi:hypothetical protein